MVGEVSSGLVWFKVAFNTASALKTIHENVKRNEAISEILDALVTAQAEQLKLMEENSGLKRQLAEREAWESESQRYQLSEVAAGVLARTPKEFGPGKEPFHMLCANCFEKRQKAFLQATQEIRHRRRVYKCHGCKSDYEIDAAQGPMPLRPLPTSGTLEARKGHRPA